MNRTRESEAAFVSSPGCTSTAGSIVCSVIAMLLSLPIRADDIDKVRVGRQLAASCATCHGTEGKAQGAMPVLAGISKDYFLEQMRAFTSGARQATVMHQLAKGYSQEQIEQLADYFVNQTR